MPYYYSFHHKVQCFGGQLTSSFGGLSCGILTPTRCVNLTHYYFTNSRQNFLFGLSDKLLRGLKKNDDLVS